MGKDWYSDEKATLGDRISVAREKSGQGVDELARKLGVRGKTLTGWENDEREPRANHLRMLAGLTGISLIWLLTGQSETGPGSDPGSAPSDKDVIRTELTALQQTIAEATRRLGRLEKLLSDD